MKQENNSEWQYRFLKKGKEYGFGDLSAMVNVVSEILKEERYKGYEEGRDDGFKEGKNAALEEAIALSDLIESQNIIVFDEWRAFKQFRNTLRDKLKHK